LEECGRSAHTASRNERRAEAAERELKLVYVLRLLEQHIGAESRGIVTGVANFGVSCNCRNTSGRIAAFQDLADDWWEVDSEAGCVVGQRTRRRLKIGDVVRVAIARINLAARELDLALADEAVSPGHGVAGGPRRARGDRHPGERSYPAAG